MIYGIHFIHSWRDWHLRMETEEKLFGLKKTGWFFTVQGPHLRFINRNYSSTRGEQTSNVALQQALTTQLIYPHSKTHSTSSDADIYTQKQTLNKTKTIHLVLLFFHPVLWIFEILLFFYLSKCPLLWVFCAFMNPLLCFLLSLVMELQPVLHLLLPLYWFRTSFLGLCALSSSCRLIQMNDSEEMCL